MIRKGLLEDAKALKDIHTKAVLSSCATCYSGDQLSAWTAGDSDAFARVVQSAPICFVYVIDISPVGFISIRGDKSIWHLYVLPEFSGQGIGTSLLYEVEVWMKKNGVMKSRLQSSLNAHDFYIKNGYTEIERRHLTFKGVSIPVVEMEKDLLDWIHRIDSSNE